MKIALVIDDFDPHTGGAEHSVARILDGLHRRGHTLLLCAAKWKSPLPVPMERHHVRVAPFPRWRRDWSFAESSAALVRQLSPDLTLGVRHTPAVDVFLARGGLHCETVEANLRANPSLLNRLLYRCSPKQRVLQELERRLFCRPDPPLVIVPSEMVKRHCLEHFACDPLRVRVVRTGVDLARLRPAEPARRDELRARLGLGNLITVLFAAHNFRLKGLDCLLAAWRQLDPQRFRLLIVGKGKAHQVPRTVPGVEYLGERSDIVELYQAADVLAHPTFYDPFSRVVIEALACGLPVITTRYNGTAEILADGREGYVLADPRQTGELAERLTRFADTAAREKMPAAARRLAEQYPESAFLAQMVEQIEAEARRLRSA